MHRLLCSIILTVLVYKLYNISALNWVMARTVCLALLSAAQAALMTSYAEINDAPLVLLLAYMIELLPVWDHVHVKNGIT